MEEKLQEAIKDISDIGYGFGVNELEDFEEDIKPALEKFRDSIILLTRYPGGRSNA